MSETATQPVLFGGIEAGGTHFICVLADSRGYTKARIDIPTTTADETLAAARDFFLTRAPEFGQLAALGIVSFGPLDLNWASPTHGYITRNARPGWSEINLRGYFKDALKVLIELETDVNGSAVGEFSEGAAVGCENFVYVTVGTGIGAGIFAGGKLMQGISHPEVGHMLVPRDENDHFEGCCPFHGACLEGLASGMALQKSWNVHPRQLPDDHPAWELQSRYLAMMCVNLTWMYAPEKIIFGGGVMARRRHLYPMIRAHLKQMLGSYAHDSALDDMDRYVIPTGLDGNAGIIGALSLARRVYFESRN